MKRATTLFLLVVSTLLASSNADEAFDVRQHLSTFTRRLGKDRVNRDSTEYEIYLSFFGAGNNIANSLYNLLRRRGIRIFLSNGGNNLSTKQRQAMHQSGMHAVVFSKEYCSSLEYGHLDELVEMINLKNARGTPFIPIFYDVDPDDVRNQTGPFAELFSKHEKMSQVDCEKVRKWREALIEAADSPKLVFRSVEDGDAANFIKHMVEEISLRDTESKLISDIVEEVMFTCSSFPKAFETLPPFSKIPSNCWNYDVFLSFRGKDTGKTFSDHLNSALRHAGISTFLADDKLTRGENISTGLNNAIRGSSVSIVVFSKGYASSKWCLDEIAEIMQCMENRGHSFLPIFFNVSPSDVRNQTGAFAKAFARHKKKFEADRVKHWRAALTNAGNRAGLSLKDQANGYESKLIKMIVEKVLSNVIHGGMDSRVKKLRGLLNLGTPKVCIVGIYGIGGIGKTTLAEAVFNQLSDSFEGSSFLLNIQGVSGQPHGIVHLQKLLLYNILKTKNLEIVNEYEGITLIKKSLHGKRVLIVLDNVDCMQQVHLLAGNRKWLGPGSRIIVTTRNEQLLTQLGVDEKMKVEELDYWESNELFSWHSFEGNINESKDHSELSSIAAECIGGVPLALKLFGSFLRGRSIDEWEMKLDELRRVTAPIEQQALAPHIHKEKKRKITLADECQR